VNQIYRKDGERNDKIRFIIDFENSNSTNHTEKNLVLFLKIVRSIVLQVSPDKATLVCALFTKGWMKPDDSIHKFKARYYEHLQVLKALGTPYDDSFYARDFLKKVREGPEFDAAVNALSQDMSKLTLKNVFERLTRAEERHRDRRAEMKDLNIDQTPVKERVSTRIDQSINCKII
jgi:hypothetical protein